MLPFILRSKAFRLRSLPLGAFLLAAAHPSRAQSTSQPQQNTVEPQLTLGVRPASAIADSLRPKDALSPLRSSRSLLMALPGPNTPKAWPVSAPTPRISGGVPPKNSSKDKPGAPLGTLTETANRRILVASAGETGGALSRSAAPATEIAEAKRVKVTTKSRFVASRVAVQVAASPDVKSTSMDVTATSAAPTSKGNASVPPLPSFPPASSLSRPRGAQLPSRGGLVRSAPIEVRPQAPEIAPMSASQHRLLAQLDADLGLAQHRLSRAETRLSEGQKQLGSFNDVLRSAMLDAGDDARGLHPFVRVAQRYMGTPYVWGGESARGFDCSGFIMRVMRDLGYRALPHSAAEQFRYGLPIAKPLLKPGDVVFFANTYKPGISHVGIYLGRGRFIHAANSKVGTIVSHLDEPKWVEHYAGARRLLPIDGEKPS